MGLPRKADRGTLRYGGGKQVPEDGLSHLSGWTSLLVGADHRHGGRVAIEAETRPYMSSGFGCSCPEASIPGVRSQKFLT